MQLDDIKALIHEPLSAVEHLLAQQLDSPASLIKEIGAHLMQSGGKRLRPMLVILVAYAYQSQNGAELLLAAAVELIHTATLLHDDVVDYSQMRRGESTANAIWDNAASVLVGDFLYSRAFQLIVRTEEIAVLQMLAQTTNLIATGEILQLQNRHNLDVTQTDYLDVLRYKTGALFSAATQAGAISAHRPAAEVAGMAKFGESLGIAFQLIDDALDYVADETTLGKQLGDDLAEGKLTLPVLHAMQHTNATNRAFIEQTLRDGCRDSLPKLRLLIKETGSIDYTHTLAERYKTEAALCLDMLQPSPYRDALRSLAELAVHRNY